MNSQQTCKACGRPDKFNFDVPDDVWRAAVPAHLQNRVVCLGCFDEFAKARGVAYAKSLTEVCFAGGASFMFKVMNAAD